MAVTTIRPNSTDTNVSVTLVGGGATVHGNTSDNNNATRITASVANAYARLGFPNTVVLGTSRARSVSIRARIYNDGSTPVYREYVGLLLRDPGTAGVPSTNLPQYVGGTVFSTGIDTGPYVYYAAPGTNQPWTQAKLDRLQLQIKFYDSPGSGLNVLQVAELFVDVDVVAVPVTSVVTVSNFTSTTKPQVDWTFTHAEYSQTAYQVLVYSAAQYGAAGFVPGISTATYDSGIISSADTTHTLTTDLQNNVTYRAYVQTAIDWPGPEGKFWWSGYVAMTVPGANFTEAVTPPAAPVLTATVQAALPGFRVLLNVSTPLNLLTENQASLETDTSGWAAVANNTISRSTAWSAHGAASLQMSSTAAGDMSAAVSARPSIKQGQRVVITATGRSAVSVRSVRIDIRWYDIAGALISTTTGTAANDATGADTPWYATGVAPVNTRTADVLINVLATGGAAEIHRFDKIGMFFYPTDPGTAVAAAALWSAGGYASNATLEILRAERVSDTITRGRASNHIHPQLFSGGALTTLTDGFYPRQANDLVRQLVLDRAAPEGPLQTTAGMIEWTINVGAFSYLDFGVADGVATDGTHPYAFPAQPGRDFTFSVWIWAAAAWSGKLYIQYTNAFNTAIGAPIAGSALAITTTEQKCTVTGTAPAGTVYAHVILENSAGTNGHLVYVTMPRWRPNDEPDEPFPGQVFAFVWKPVRATSAFRIGDGQQSVNIYDHEMPGGRPAIYRARVLATSSTGFSMASDPSVPVHISMPYPAATLLGDPLQPENWMVARRLEDTTSQDDDYTIYHPRGASKSPVKVSDFIGGEDGQLQVACRSELDLYRLRQLLPAQGSPLLVKWKHGGQSYILVTTRSVEEIRVGGPQFIVTLGYVETTRP